MATKPKARRAPRRDPKRPKEKTQGQRFIETARNYGVDETGETFEEAIRRLVPPKKP
jgi:hypothetical protein